MIETITDQVATNQLMGSSVDQPLVSVVMPCLNEEKAIASCIQKIQTAFSTAGVVGEIVVADNGSTDNSIAIAEKMGARVVHQPLRGYGNAYIKGFSHAKGDYLIMGDADDTYDFLQIPQFLDCLRNRGYDFVTGSRYLQGGQSTIPVLHRLFGNPALTALLNFLFGTKYTDVYCGFRGFTRQAYDLIQPVSPGMEFNLELAINAGLTRLNITEIPIRLHPRKGESKLRTFRDGWRSLRMMLIYCPNKVFLLPGLFLLILGLLIHAIVLLNLMKYQDRSVGAVTSVFATIFSVVGFEVLSLGLHVKTYSWSRRFDRDNALLKYFYQFFTLEIGLLTGFVTAAIGGLILIRQVVAWLNSNLTFIPNSGWTSFAATLTIIGLGTIFSSLFISAMSMKKIEAYDQQL
ncbi:MAG: glycosyltransferase family 2 protein [Oculatellaceae cyanobacterium bins.114]|nr:glycosyltransferase family 2 protein [Oculatellaceae cyanobacterium bins.114]